MALTGERVQIKSHARQAIGSELGDFWRSIPDPLTIKVLMRKPTLEEIVTCLIILIGLPAFLYTVWLFSRPKPDSRTLEDKVQSALGLKLADLQTALTLIPVTNNSEPFELNFVLPLTVDAAGGTYCPDGFGKYRGLSLIDNGTEVDGYDISRKTNATYIIKWNTLFAGYGTHTLQMRLMFPTHGGLDGAEAFGTKLETTVTNLLQWDYEGSGFGRWSTFKATLHIPSADYSLFIYDTNRTLIKRIDGHTDTGSIAERWDTPPTNKYAWTDEDLKAKIAITPTDKDADGQIKPNAPTSLFPYPGRWISQ